MIPKNLFNKDISKMKNIIKFYFVFCLNNENRRVFLVDRVQAGMTHWLGPWRWGEGRGGPTLSCAFQTPAICLLGSPAVRAGERAGDHSPSSSRATSASPQRWANLHPSQIRCRCLPLCSPPPSPLLFPATSSAPSAAAPSTRLRFPVPSPPVAVDSPLEVPILVAFLVLCMVYWNHFICSRWYASIVVWGAYSVFNLKVLGRVLTARILAK